MNAVVERENKRVGRVASADPSAFGFSLDRVDSTGARAGAVRTRHGLIHTPVFMPVGTQGTVKAMTPGELKSLGAEVVLANTYHLFLRPGHERIARLGGLHRFMNWERPILTDSGGYQVYSLGELRRIDDDGVTFQSHLDGGMRHRLTPETAIQVQEALGSDIMMAFDECPPYPAARGMVAEACERTTRWAARCKEARTRTDAALFGIVQGGTEGDLRREHAEKIVEIGFDGYAIGGLSVGEPKRDLVEMTEAVAGVLPSDRPRYLMGVGTPEDLVEGIARGVDMFDCVMPTRHARNGFLFTRRGRMIITHARYADDPGPIDEACSCETCRHYSRAYLRHIFTAKEILAMRLLTIHNLHVYLSLMREARTAIMEGRYLEFLSHFRSQKEDDECLDG